MNLVSLFEEPETLQVAKLINLKRLKAQPKEELRKAKLEKAIAAQAHEYFFFARCVDFFNESNRVVTVYEKIDGTELTEVI